MQGDFSVFHYDPHEHDRGVNPPDRGVLRNINGVLHQQGRVITDADLTEGELLELAWNGQAGRDIIGSGVCAVPSAAPQSFRVESALVTDDKVHVMLRPGRAWADGILTRMAGETPDPHAPVERLATYFGPPLTDPEPTPGEINGTTRDAVILEVSEEALHGFQYPQRLIEPALGGPDTSERAFVNFRIRLLRLADGEDCNTIVAKLRDDPSSKGRLTASLAPVVAIAGDCPVVGGGGYTGFEHNLYRIEIADGAPSTPPRFKWSQWNGGLVGRGRFDATLTPPRVIIDAGRTAIVNSGLTEFYLEALQYDELDGTWNVVYGTIATLNTEHDLELAAPATFGTLPSITDPVFFRLWNGLRNIAEFTNAANPVELRDGIRLAFDAPGAGNYQPRDYWTFKVHAGEIANPPILIDQAPPTGIVYHRVPLAEIDWTAAQNTQVSGTIEDCRKPFRPLIDPNGCCTYEVGNGVDSRGDFDSIEEAVKHLPAKGGRICVLPGVHHANLRVGNRENIHITGCGDQTIVHPRVETPDQEIFGFSSSRNIKIDNLTLITHAGIALLVKDAPDATKATEGMTIERNRIFALTHGLCIGVKNELAGNNAIRIRDNIINMWDLEGGDVAIFSSADDVLIHNNEIRVVPAPDPEDPQDPRDPGGPDGELYDPCDDKGQYYAQPQWWVHVVYSTLAYLNLAGAFKPIQYKAKGGIQIGGGSEMVRITYNRIIGGNGNGLTLGDLPTEGGIGTYFENRLFVNQLDVLHQQYLEQNLLGYLYEIAIENNFIASMGLSGIGVAAFLHLEEVGLMISVDEITIRENHITNCANQVPDDKPEPMLKEVGFGGIVLASCENVVISNNKIQDNGRHENQAVCGVLILYGEDVDISDNRIINNGPLGRAGGEALDRGLRGGIVVGLSFKQLIYEVRQNKGFTRPDGIPAVKVHDNIVVQPMGQALFLIAFGPVSVVGNQFTTQGADYTINPSSVIAGAVFIVNLGVSQDLMAFLFLMSFRYVAAGNHKQFTQEGAMTVVETPGMEAALRFLYLPSGSVMYNANQTTLDLQDKVIDFAFSAQAIVSLDDVAYNNNQSEVRSVFDILLTDVALVGATVRASDNRFQEGFTIALNSLISVGFMNMATANQATHCIQVFGPPAFTFEVANSVLYQVRPCADYARIIGRYVGV